MLRAAARFAVWLGALPKTANMIGNFPRKFLAGIGYCQLCAKLEFGASRAQPRGKWDGRKSEGVVTMGGRMRGGSDNGRKNEGG